MSKHKIVPLGEADRDHERERLRNMLDTIERETELVEAEMSRLINGHSTLVELAWCDEELKRLHALAEPIRLKLFRTTDFLHRSVKS